MKLNPGEQVQLVINGVCGKVASPAGASKSIFIPTQSLVSSIVSSNKTYEPWLSVRANFGASPFDPSVSSGCTCSGAVAWTSSGKNCNGVAPTTSEGNTTVVVDSGAPATGSASFQCTSGSLVYVGGTCAEECAATTLSWGAGCSFSTAAVANGWSGTVSNSVAGFSGSAAFTCNNGSWSAPSSASCSSTSCAATSVSWNTNCSASLGSASSGASLTLTNSASGYSGSATYTCNNGSWSGPASASCSGLSCSSTAVTWNTNCSASLASASHGATVTATNSAAGYSGSANYSCSGGVWSSPSSASCNTSTACDYTSLALASGQVCTGTFVAGNTIETSGGGSITAADYATCQAGGATCWQEYRYCANCNDYSQRDFVDWQCTIGPVSSGSGDYYAGSCSGGSSSCNSTTLTWNSNCSAVSGTASNTGYVVLTNSASGYTGSAKFTCNNGTWSSPTNVSCSAVTTCPAGMTGTPDSGAACSVPWGTTMPSGCTKIAYSKSITNKCSAGNPTPRCDICDYYSQPRTCSNGTLSGSGTYMNQNCTQVCGGGMSCI